MASLVVPQQLLLFVQRVAVHEVQDCDFTACLLSLSCVSPQKRIFVCYCRVKLDDDLPGGGQHYCISCSKYFVSEGALKDHTKTKPHKRRIAALLKLQQKGMKPHNGLDAQMAAGMGAPDNGTRVSGSDGGVLMMAE
jgi:hypothetical protein